MEYKVSLQYAQWDEQWKKRQETNRKKAVAERKRQERAKIAADNEKAMLLAKQQTEDANKAQIDIDNILLDRAEGIEIEIENLKHKNMFLEPRPAEPVLYKYDREPKR